ncbi:MAG: chemotaxis protein CheA [Myxococcales bacterium FL481]|nr:MAG: chemotaxis protein CheA [Myxococcales bacterium FL481]
MSEDFDDEIVAEFVTESGELLDQLDATLVALEQNGGDDELVAAAFRTLHTIKGNAGFLGFEPVQRLAHAGENLLSRIRDRVLQLDEPRATALLATLDQLRAMLDEVESSGAVQGSSDTELVRTLAELTSGATLPGGSVQPNLSGASAGVIVDRSGSESAAMVDREASADAAAVDGQALPVAGTPDKPAPPSGATTRESAEAFPSAPGARRGSPQPPGRHPPRSAGGGTTALRVDVGLLDELMGQVGELVLTRNEILERTKHVSDRGLTNTVQRLDRVATRLQEGVMRTRMQPVANMWAKFPRIVRDLGHTCGKKVRITFAGEETGLDKALIEALRDPMTHLLRNAVDHGIERPDARVAAGKSATGTIHLSARQQSGRVIIEFSDDGGGIDLDRVRQRAVDKGLLTSAAADALDRQASLELLFSPGFSTAESVSQVSGRGVGMDVVKTNIERVGGKLEVETELGAGSTFRISVPLTVAIVPSLIARVDRHQFVVPQAALDEIVALSATDERCIELSGKSVLRLRGEVVASVDMRTVLELEGDPPRERHALVLQGNGSRYALVVDAIEDTAEIVIKPLGRLLEQIPIYAGSTLLPNGGVALILDPLVVAQRHDLLSTVAEKATKADDTVAACRDAFATLRFPGAHRLAVPLSSLHRVEEFHSPKIERIGDRPVIQYRDHIMPLVDFDGHRLVPAAYHDGEEAPDRISVAVLCDQDRQIGALVEDVEDVAEVERRHAGRFDVLGGSVTRVWSAQELAVELAPYHLDEAERSAA